MPENGYRDARSRERVQEEAYRETRRRSPERAQSYDRNYGEYDEMRGKSERAQARYDAAGRRIRESAGDLYHAASERDRRSRYDAGMEEVILQREKERAKRAREARERLERERREDERRRAARRELEYGESRKSTIEDDFDDFEMIDLN